MSPILNRFILVLLVGVLAVPSVSAQGILLRHKFVPGQSAQAVSDVRLNGKSVIFDSQADTDLRIKMFREFRVREVDGTGNALLDVFTRRIQAQGVMNGDKYNQDIRPSRDPKQSTEAKFDEDLTGDPLSQVMFGAEQVSMKVTPLGRVIDPMASQLGLAGISLPTNLSSGGGFEFPTFPSEPVAVGVCWTEDGSLLPRYGAGAAGSRAWVYQLHRVFPSAQGRRAVIRYQKTTDLSGLGLGDGPGLGGPSELAGPSASATGLVIQLEGEIEFSLDQGIVTRSAQQGTWNLVMDSNSGKDRKKVPVEQKGMRLQIQTQLQWGSLQGPQPPKPPVLPVKKPEVQPPVEAVPPPPVVVVPETKELP